MTFLAAKIPVSRFDTTFFWPLTLDADPGCMQSEIGERIDQEVDRLEASGRWINEPDLLQHIPLPADPGQRPERKAGETDKAFTDRLDVWLVSKSKLDEHLADSYAEYTYFHDFVQHFLFDKVPPAQKRRWGGQDQHRPIRLLRRTDIKSVSVTMDKGYSDAIDGVYRFEVKRLNLYVLRGGVAMLALELSNTDGLVHERCEHYGPQASSRPVTLRDVLLFNDRMRRSHAPYVVRPDRSRFESAFKAPGGMVPLTVTLHGGVRSDGTNAEKQFNIPDDVAERPNQLKDIPGDARCSPSASMRQI